MQGEKEVDRDVLAFKVIYINGKMPVLYYLKTDGYWYSYDFYNKENPVKTKIDLDNIVAVKQFTYDNGNEIRVFVDVQGNLHETVENIVYNYVEYIVQFLHRKHQIYV